ncbi:SRPBCC family protein [bacterium]|nr:SRPBCC family protein [bacterium]
MKYTNEIILNKPLEEVIEKFTDPDGLKHWMEGLQSTEQLEGEPGTEGAKMKMHFKTGKREIEMVETILINDLPNQFKSSYDVPGVYNEIDIHFEKIDENTTKYSSENLFKFQNFGMKVISWLMPGAFKKQTQKYMVSFKEYVEDGKSVQA